MYILTLFYRVVQSYKLIHTKFLQLLFLIIVPCKLKQMFTK